MAHRKTMRKQRKARRQADLRDRTLHLIDLENLCGGPDRIPVVGRAVWRQYEAQFVTVGDQFRFAVSHRAWMAAIAVVGDQACVSVRSGRDGADLCLIDRCDPEWIAARFRRVLIASGDHVFSTLAAELRRWGTEVVVTTGIGGLSRVLAAQADVVAPLALEPADEVAA